MFPGQYDPICAPTCFVGLGSPEIRRVFVSSDLHPNTLRGYQEPCPLLIGSELDLPVKRLAEGNKVVRRDGQWEPWRDNDSAGTSSMPTEGRPAQVKLAGLQENRPHDGRKSRTSESYHLEETKEQRPKGPIGTLVLLTKGEEPDGRLFNIPASYAGTRDVECALASAPSKITVGHHGMLITRKPGLFQEVLAILPSTWLPMASSAVPCENT